MIDSFTGEHRFLSNFYDCFVEVRGRNGVRLFASAEAAYQAAKTRDPEWQRQIRLARSPREAKILGRQVPMREDWDEIKVDVMREVIEAKFFGALRERLINTWPHTLVEGNTWGDEFWGMCYVGDNHWRGENWLGKILMERREELRT